MTKRYYHFISTLKYHVYVQLVLSLQQPGINNELL